VYGGGPKRKTVAADEVFVIAGQLSAVLAAASEQVRLLRDALDRAAREDQA